MADTKDVVKATDGSNDKREKGRREGPRQTVVREPDEETFGPFFPSGMSAPEAAVAGAIADMDEETVARIQGKSTKASKSSKRDDE